MDKRTADTIQAVALLAAICVLCWLFDSGWPVLLIFLLAS